MRAQIERVSDSDWQPLLDKKGEAISGQATYRTVFCIGDYENAFTLVIQRKALKGQTSLDLDSQESSEEISRGGYIYRAIATNRDELSDSQVIHWYNQRAVTLRWRLYAIAAKVVKTGRQLFVKLKEKHRTLLEQVLAALKEFEPPPIRC